MQTLNPIHNAGERLASAKAEQQYLDLFGPAASILISRIQDRSVEAIQVASGWPGEGSTTMTLGLAHCLHQRYGARVQVVELNFPRPAMADLFGIGDDRTLAAFAAGKISARNASTEVASGFSVVPAGSVGPSLRRSVPRLLNELLEDAAGRYDIVLVDTPPILESAEAGIAGKVVPNLLLIVQAGHASLESLDRVRASLDSQGVVLIGCILNDVRTFMPARLYRRLNR